MRENSRVETRRVDSGGGGGKGEVLGGLCGMSAVSSPSGVEIEFGVFWP